MSLDVAARRGVDLLYLPEERIMRAVLNSDVTYEDDTCVVFGPCPNPSDEGPSR